MVAVGVMGALPLTSIAHCATTSSYQQTRYGVVGCKVPALVQIDSVFGFAASELQGDFRKPSQLFLGNGFRVSGRQSQWQRSALDIRAVDAAQPFDYESRKLQELEKSSKLKVGIVGFGNYGQFLAARITSQGHRVLAHSRTDYSEKAQELGVTYFRNADDFCEEHPEVVLLCTSILSTVAVLQSLPLQRLRRNTLFVDVLSVKEFPKNLFLQALPAEFDVLCTHPMFGPESGKGSWAGLPFVYDKVRISNGRRSRIADRFLDIFASEMTCAEHDRYAAGSQFITHTVGRVLGKLGLESTPINTKGYETLLRLVENTEGDSFDLYYGLFMYNPNATEELERLEIAFDSIKRQLFGQLHDVLRKQLFGANVADKARLPHDPSNSSSTNGISKNGGSGIASNSNTALPILESVLGNSNELDKDSDSISKSSKQ
uniref:Prephenate/arogenate dehydrogenase domain-containing protein n=1 Tax=Physcomitrium patens TaxID=3218 RepID=A0A7I4DKM4_PHYPA